MSMRDEYDTPKGVTLSTRTQEVLQLTLVQTPFS